MDEAFGVENEIEQWAKPLQGNTGESTSFPLTKIDSDEHKLLTEGTEMGLTYGIGMDGFAGDGLTAGLNLGGGSDLWMMKVGEGERGDDSVWYLQRWGICVC